MIVVAGEALIDLLVDVDGDVTSVVGGGPLNTARAAARLGAETAFIGGVSNDALGQRIARLIADDGVQLPVPRSDAPTMLAVAALDESGTANFRFMSAGTAAAALTPASAVAALPTTCEILHVGTLGLVLHPLAEATCAAVDAVGPDCIVMVDPNSRPAVAAELGGSDDALAHVLHRVDVLKVSADDLAIMAPGLETISAARRMREHSSCVVLLTDGSNAVHVVGDFGDFAVGVPKVKVADTVGAGDTFSGAFAAWWTRRGLGRADLDREDDLRSAVQFAVAAASVACQRAGADPPWIDEVPGGWE